MLRSRFKFEIVTGALYIHAIGWIGKSWAESHPRRSYATTRNQCPYRIKG